MVDMILNLPLTLSIVPDPSTDLVHPEYSYFSLTKSQLHKQTHSLIKSIQESK